MIEAFVIEFHSEGEYPLSEVYWLEKEIRQLLQSDRAEMIKKILPEKKINFGRDESRWNACRQQILDNFAHYDGGEK